MATAKAAVAVIVVAAGAGSRLGLGLPKAFAPLGKGTVLETALSGIRSAGVPAHVIVVAPPDHLDEARRIAERVQLTGDRPVAVVPGGASRADSVAAGLQALAPEIGTVLVHDAARALTPPELFDTVAELVLELGCGVVPVLPVVDTVKRVRPDGEVAETLDRQELALAQTPQGFPRAQLEAAYRVTDATALTDDAAVVSAAGHRVVSTVGAARAFKITDAQDLARAEAILLESSGGSRATRTGVGADAHAFGDTPPLMLAGVAWPDHPALSGHSDGDAACHAIVDAILSAATLGDIGTVFGVDDPARDGYSGLAFIADAVALVASHGWTIHSVAVEIIANAPRIGDRRAELERILEDAVGAPVTVAGTTADGLGLTGEGRGIGAVASALLSR